MSRVNGLKDRPGFVAGSEGLLAQQKQDIDYARLRYLRRKGETVELVNKRAAKVMNMIAAVNTQGYKPSRVEVNNYGSSPERLVTEFDPYYDDRGEFWDVETYSAYLERLKWVEIIEDAAVLTPMGLAVLRAMQDQGKLDNVSVLETVLESGDPFAYARAIAVLADVPDALVVDPYIKLDGLMDIMPLSSVTRILTSSERGNPSKKAGPFALASAARPGNRQIRIAELSRLHDRYFIPRTGPVRMISTSMNSIGSRIGVITPLGASASQAVREEHEKIWTDSVPVESVDAEEPTPT